MIKTVFKILSYTLIICCVISILPSGYITTVVVSGNSSNVYEIYKLSSNTIVTTAAYVYKILGFFIMTPKLKLYGMRNDSQGQIPEPVYLS